MVNSYFNYLIPKHRFGLILYSNCQQKCFCKTLIALKPETFIFALTLTLTQKLFLLEQHIVQWHMFWSVDSFKMCRAEIFNCKYASELAYELSQMSLFKQRVAVCEGRRPGCLQIGR